jgi:hypothetical protein
MAVYQDQVIFQKNRTLVNVKGKIEEYKPCLTGKNNIQMVNVKNIRPVSERV